MDLTLLSLSIKVFELEFDCDRTHSVARRLGDSSSITHQIRTPLLQTYDLALTEEEEVEGGGGCHLLLASARNLPGSCIS